MAAISVEGLEKLYGDVRAVDGVDFEIAEGEVFALLGPNGAGKTTTVEILEGHRTRTAGRVSVLGEDPETAGREYRERIGIVLQSGSLERDLTVGEAIDIYAALYPSPMAGGDVIEIVGLEQKVDARIKTLSGGQQRRLELALGIVGDPDLIFLDEPTTGFDPSARRQAWSLVDNLRSLGKTILLTTHYMDEAQHLADRVAVIASGKIVASGDPDTLGGRADSVTTVAFGLPPGMAIESLPSGVGATAAGERFEVQTRTPTAVLHTLTGWAVERGVELAGLSVSQPSLEDIYLELTSREGE